MFWWIIIGIVVLSIVLHLAGFGETDNRVPPSDDLSEEEIEYDYLQREEQAQEEEDEYWLEQRDK